jgi:predicted HTH transcriptional regulator
MNEAEKVIDEIRDIEVQINSAMLRMRQCFQDAKQLLESAEQAVAKLSTGKLRRQFSQIPDNHLQVFRAIASNGWPTSEVLGERLGRSRKSIRLSVEWLKKAGMVERDGRKMTVTALGRSAAKGL